VRAWSRQTRVRLAFAYSGIFGLVALFAAGATWVTVARVAYAAVDDSLVSAAQTLQVAAAAAGDHPISGQASPGSAPGTARGAGITAFLFDGDGSILDRTALVPSSTDLAPLLPRARASTNPSLQTANLDGVRHRVRTSPVEGPGGRPEFLVVVRSMAEADQLVSTTAAVLVAGIIVLMVAATVLGYGLAGTALRPVREITAEARALSEQDLHRRIGLDLPADELGDLAQTFNQMLDRLETAFNSLGQFTADAAHELRAPLTLIRTEAEVTLRRPRSAEEYQASLATILAEAERLGRVADQLLMLARAESGALATQMQHVELSGMVADAVRLWSPLALERGVTLSGDGDSLGRVRGDPDLLRRLLDNLLDNAIRHAPGPGAVRVSGRRVDRGWELAVADSGPGVPGAARASIFDRFARADTARGRETGGAGLGLALCRAIAELHQGSIRVEGEPGGGARFVVVLPAEL